jgi:hypothetical protein
MARPSPGRSRTVIRSVAGWRLDSSDVAPGNGPSDSRSARIAIRANADSEMPLLAANCANRSFSPGVGRAVMVPDYPMKSGGGAESDARRAEEYAGGVESDVMGAEGRSVGVLNRIQPGLPSEFSKELSKEESKHNVRRRTVRVGGQGESKSEQESFEECRRKALKLLQAIPDLRVSELRTQAHLTDQEGTRPACPVATGA